jgi:hypothetical protein
MRHGGQRKTAYRARRTSLSIVLLFKFLLFARTLSISFSVNTSSAMLHTVTVSTQRASQLISTSVRRRALSIVMSAMV